YLLTLIDDILDLSKVEAGILRIQKTSFHVNELFNELAIQFKLKLQNLKKQIKFVIKKERPDEYSVIVSDKNRIQQLLTNLVDNAIKFTTEGTITMSYYADDKLGIVFSVADTGMGIARKDHQLILNGFINRTIMF
ncbi:MAG: hypothetical protein HC830_06685, partial [Bacteroidetes bacterium]|nr:hypothetical protein [Bacteroidota bacterium]